MNSNTNLRFYSMVQLLVTIEKAVVAITMIIIILGISYGIIHRFFATGAIIGLEEICVLAGTWMYFIGACIATHNETHIKGDVITLFIKDKKILRYIDIMIKLCVILLLGFVSFKVYQYISMVSSIGVLTTGLKVHRTWFLWSMFVGFVLMIVHEVIRIFDPIKK